MRVLLVNTPHAPGFRGGDLTQMRETGKALRSLGVEVHESFDAQPDATGFDLAHVFNLRTIATTPGQVLHLRKQGIPVVLSPIYLNPSSALWANRVIQAIFRREPELPELSRLLTQFQNRSLRIRQEGGNEIAAIGENRPQPNYDEIQRRTVALCDHLLPNSHLEQSAFLRTLRMTALPFTVVPYGVDAQRFLDPDPEPFVRKYGLRDFVLSAGRVEASKNQLLVALALRNADAPYVLIGGNKQPEYLAWIRKYGGKNVRYIPHLDPDELRSAYAAARVHVLASWMETCGLVHMEAALADCSLVVSTAGYETEYYGNEATYCDPASVSSIQQAVSLAWRNHPENRQSRDALKQRILAGYTWDRAARLTLGAYQEVLQRRAKGTLPSDAFLQKLLASQTQAPAPAPEPEPAETCLPEGGNENPEPQDEYLPGGLHLPKKENAGPHILFVHKNFPAQFGHIAAHLVENHGYRCSFVSELPGGEVAGIHRIQYKVTGGATQRTHYCSRTFENATWHTHAVYEALRQRPDICPDLIIGHSGFGSTLFLRELYDAPILNYFEYYYRTQGADFGFRKENVEEMGGIRAQARNAMILLDLDACTRGYSPTRWQHSLFPTEFQPKIDVIFDGIDRRFWHRREGVARRIGEREIPPTTRIVTYVSRGFESMRGFDIFMQIAKRICEARPDVVIVAVGSDRDCYSGDSARISGKSYREHILEQDQYDLNRILFPGRIPPDQLVDLLSISDLHLYLTAPFVLSWSMMNALSCGCTVLASDTAPVTEMIEHGVNGLLAGFFDIDRFTELSLQVLDDPEAYRELGRRAEERIEEHYSLARTLPRMLGLYEQLLG